MLSRLGRSIALVLATIVAAVGGLTVSAQADPADGFLVVSVSDQYGDPVPAALRIWDASGDSFVDDGDPAAALRAVPLPPGTYGVAAMTSFGGLACSGIAVCDPNVATFELDSSTAVAVGADTKAVHLTVTLPSIAGTGVVGAPLTLSVPPQLTALEQSLVGASQSTGTPYTGILQVLWLRDGVPTGATGTTYVPSAADADRSISARISRDYVGTSMVNHVIVDAPTSYETQAVAVTAPPTTTPPGPTTPLARASITAKLKRGARPAILVRVTARGAKPTGSVELALGSWRRHAVLRGGSVRIPVGDFRPGTYRLRVEYAGSATVASGVMAKKLKIRAVRGR